MEKQPGARFKDYDELRQAIAPFGSTAPSPAPLGVRFAAGALDMFLIGLVGLAIMLGVSGQVLPFAIVAAPPGRHPQMLGVVAASFTVVLLYYTILEGSGARVSASESSASESLAPIGILPDRSRLLLGPSFMNSCLSSPTGLASASIRRACSASVRWRRYGLSLLFYAILAGLFVTARFRNGFAAVHDLASGTRVIRPPAFQPRPSLPQSAERIPVSETTPMVGPFHVLDTLESGEQGEWLLAYDTRLLRKVWLHRLPTGAPPVPPAQRNLGRAGRLRWIAGTARRRLIGTLTRLLPANRSSASAISGSPGLTSAFGCWTLPRS